ncbi:MAG: family ATPase [Frondihabitans sp.]|nr:family ATPase [Frondihabitans sp.]
MLGPHDPLPHAPRRVLVAGVTGTGKTTFAARVAPLVGGTHTEIDGLFHGPRWTPREEFLDDVDRFTREDRWVTEWQYRLARPLLAERADTLVWLDLPFRVSLLRLVRRTWRRSQSREVLWNGNIEPRLRTIVTDRDHIIRWGLRTRRNLLEMVPAAERAHPALQVVRLRSQRDVDDWIANLA